MASISDYEPLFPWVAELNIGPTAQPADCWSIGLGQNRFSNDPCLLLHRTTLRGVALDYQVLAPVEIYLASGGRGVFLHIVKRMREAMNRFERETCP